MSMVTKYWMNSLVLATILTNLRNCHTKNPFCLGCGVFSFDHLVYNLFKSNMSELLKQLKIKTSMLKRLRK
jgi:hypothetical protein